MRDRVELVPGSFFASVPADADAYMLKNVLHDWDDARAQQILETVRRAMTPGRRLILAELGHDHRNGDRRRIAV